MVSIDFSDWLVNELNQRGWSQSDLAKSAGINRQVVSSYINRKRQKPEPEILESIAHAFHLPPETVYRAAGLLPKINQVSEKREEVYHALASVPEDQLETVLAVIRALESKHTQGNKQTSYPSRKKNPARNVLKDK